jgi:hypothetical protein
MFGSHLAELALCSDHCQTGDSHQHFRERNEHFKDNPTRVGKKIWELDFFDNVEALRSGNYKDS